MFGSIFGGGETARQSEAASTAPIQSLTHSAFEWGIDSVVFSSGQEVGIERPGLTVFIGPNNAGKTTALRDIRVHADHKRDRQVVKDVKSTFTRVAESLEDWLRANFRIALEHDRPCVVNARSNLGLRDLDACLPKKDYVHADLLPFLIRCLNVETRLSIADPIDHVDLFGRVPKPYYEREAESFIHRLQLDETLRRRISDDVRAVFGDGIIVNAVGAKVHLNIGIEPEWTKEIDRISGNYLTKLNELPRLHEQGDGIRSFVGILLAIECSPEKMLLVDEPELFLHPPQIRRLAAAMAERAHSARKQIIVATHSAAFVQAALASAEPVSICRITRTGDVNHANSVDTNRLNELWTSPLLRSAAAIDGIFHRGTAICEGDTDCRFYEAIVHGLEKESATDGPTDIHFVHGGGKGQLATLARAYAELGVKPVVIADLDILRNKQEFTKLVESIDGRFADVESDYNATCAELDRVPAAISVRAFIRDTSEILNRIRVDHSKMGSERKAIYELLDGTGNWSQAKRGGLALLRGGALETGQRLIAKCWSWGLFVVPFGQLESWWSGGPSDKNPWFLAALEKLRDDPETFNKARQFLRAVNHYITNDPSLDIPDVVAKLFR